MNFKTESAFTKWFCKMLAAVGTEVVAFVGSKMQIAGICDRYVCHPKFRGWLEMKRNSNTVKAHQRLFMRNLVARGDTCMVVRYQSRSESVEFEDCEGHQLGWLSLRGLYAMNNDAERGKKLLEELGKARDLLHLA